MKVRARAYLACVALAALLAVAVPATSAAVQSKKPSVTVTSNPVLAPAAPASGTIAADNNVYAECPLDILPGTPCVATWTQGKGLSIITWYLNDDNKVSTYNCTGKYGCSVTSTVYPGLGQYALSVWVDGPNIRNLKAKGGT